ncbi:MAG: hypothetical protein AB8I08_37940 [Sandaracinaceae bacterium]
MAPADDAPPESELSNLPWLADTAELDRFVANAGPNVMLEELLACLPDDERIEIHRHLPPSLEAAQDWDIRPLLGYGRGALWCVGRWAISAFPGAIKQAPHAAHERWDVIVEQHHRHPEAAWIVGGLLRELGPEQGPLVRRILVGVERRFGERGRDIARLALGSGPHAKLVEE